MSTQQGYVAKPIENIKFSLFAKPWDFNNPKKKAILNPKVWGNNPRFVCRMNNPKEDDKVCPRTGAELSSQSVIIALNPLYMRMILTDIAELAKGDQTFVRRVIRNKGNIYKGDVKVNETPEVVSTLAYGQDDTGMIYLQVRGHSEREAATFTFSADFWHEMEEPGNVENALDDAAMSKRVARAWAEELLTQYSLAYYHEFVDRRPQGQGQNKPQQQAAAPASADW